VSAHHKTVCKCGAVVKQCCCPSPSKVVSVVESCPVCVLAGPYTPDEPRAAADALIEVRKTLAAMATAGACACKHDWPSHGVDGCAYNYNCGCFVAGPV